MMGGAVCEDRSGLAGARKAMFQKLLEDAQKGGAVLFCGSGFSADCLNFGGVSEIGTGSALLALLNRNLREKGHRHGFKNIQNAAQQYREKEGDHGLMEILMNQYKITRVTEDLIDIATFSWDRIYTTNYDNSIELAFSHSGHAFKTFNSTEHEDSIPGKGVEIIHLHGYVEKWTVENFRKSCILWTDSYYEIEQISHWLDRLRTDFERASLVLFIGFSFQDFHIGQVLYNISSMKSKIFS